MSANYKKWDCPDQGSTYYELECCQWLWVRRAEEFAVHCAKQDSTCVRTWLVLKKELYFRGLFSSNKHFWTHELTYEASHCSTNTMHGLEHVLREPGVESYKEHFTHQTAINVKTSLMTRWQGEWKAHCNDDYNTAVASLRTPPSKLDHPFHVFSTNQQWKLSLFLATQQKRKSFRSTKTNNNPIPMDSRKG